MPRTNRLVYFLGVATFLLFLIFIVIPKLQNPTPTSYLDVQQNPVAGGGRQEQPAAGGAKGAEGKGQVPPPVPRYMSWFPHG